jgi:hypothetical protein
VKIGDARNAGIRLMLGERGHVQNCVCDRRNEPLLLSGRAGPRDRLRWNGGRTTEAARSNDDTRTKAKADHEEVSNTFHGTRLRVQEARHARRWS